MCNYQEKLMSSCAAVKLEFLLYKCNNNKTFNFNVYFTKLITKHNDILINWIISIQVFGPLCEVM